MSLVSLVVGFSALTLVILLLLAWVLRGRFGAGRKGVRRGVAEASKLEERGEEPLWP